jgi:enoyl-CoA hydratase
MMSDLKDILAGLEKRRDIGAVILTSAVDGVFLTHFDVDEIESAVDAIPFPLSPAAVSFATQAESVTSVIPGARRVLKSTALGGVADMNIFHEVTALMRAMDKVFIAAINGRAMGGGCELALACDLRIMVEGDTEGTIVIGQPEILIGLIPGGGGTQMLARSLGVARALEHCLEGRPISPAEALEIGMVNRVVPKDALMAEAQTWAERMARRSAFAVRAIKDAIYRGSSLNWDSGMVMEKNAFLAAASQVNTRRAMQAYIPMVRAMAASGKKITLADFEELIAGTATDMTAENP